MILGRSLLERLFYLYRHFNCNRFATLKIIMQISFHGAARTVTGSKHLISLQKRTNILLDCGLFQGLGNDTDLLNSKFGFDPSLINFMLLSHAHIDHSGLIPKLVKEGFSGKIYCTAATAELAEILLHDSAEIQTYEADYINKKRAAHNLDPYEPLYTHEDVINTVGLFTVIEYDKYFSPAKNIDVLFTNNGHLIGSAAISITIKEVKKKLKFFTAEMWEDTGVFCCSLHLKCRRQII